MELIISTSNAWKERGECAKVVETVVLDLFLLVQEEEILNLNVVSTIHIII